MAEEKKIANQEVQIEDKIGNVKISTEVIATVASIATGEVEGVANMSTTTLSGIADILGGKKNKGKGVKVELGDASCVIDIYVVVDYGSKIPDVAWAVQENVKSAVESMTGMTVEKINIHVEGVSFEKDKKQDEDKETAE